MSERGKTARDLREMLSRVQWRLELLELERKGAPPEYYSETSLAFLAKEIERTRLERDTLQDAVLMLTTGDQ